jgi:hypothetical protein
MYIQIKNLDHLKQLANHTNGDMVDFYIVLANGLVKSSKRILYHPAFDEFTIVHEIDETSQEVSSNELAIKTNFITAIENKSMFGRV